MQCKEWVNNLRFCGNGLRVFDSNHSEIKFKHSVYNLSEFWERDATCKERGKQANPPSEVLHVANIAPEAYS